MVLIEDKEFIRNAFAGDLQYVQACLNSVRFRERRSRKEEA